MLATGMAQLSRSFLFQIFGAVKRLASAGSWAEARDCGRTVTRHATVARTTNRRNDMIESPRAAVCNTVETSTLGAQTDRWGDARPVRALIGGKTRTGRFRKVRNGPIQFKASMMIARPAPSGRKLVTCPSN